MKISSILNLSFFLVLCVALWIAASQQINISDRLGNKLSGDADAGSEWGAINSGMNYYKLGFLSYAGLPNFAHPKDKLYVDPNDETGESRIYTHYPPGPNWLLGVAIHVCGPNNFACYRRLPVVFAVFSILVSFALVAQVVGSFWSSVLFVGLLQIPMTTEMMHGLHYQGYALSLFILQMSLAWYVFFKGRGACKRHLAVLFFLSFLQGWLSFDYFFIATLFPLPIAFLCHPLPSRRAIMMTTGVCVAGFVTSIALHVVQIAIYFSSGTADALWDLKLSALSRGFAGAFEDLSRAAFVRSSGVETLVTPIEFVIPIVQRYVTELLPSKSQGGDIGMLIIFTALVGAMLFCLGRCLLRPSERSMRKALQPLIALSLAVTVSLLWVMIMRNHALDGTHLTFLPRHFILLLWVAGAVVVSAGPPLVNAMTESVRKISFRRQPTKDPTLS